MLVRQQPWAAERLARHAGKTLRISLGALAITLTIDSGGYLEQSDPAVVPDVVLDIIADKLSLSPLLDGDRPFDIAEYVHITGQAALAQVISDLARDLRPDPEDALAHLIGDVPAHRVTQGIEGFVHGTRNLAKRLAQNVAEYLTEETDALVGRPGMTAYTQQLARAAARAEALAPRQARLAARLGVLAGQSGKAR